MSDIWYSSPVRGAIDVSTRHNRLPSEATKSMEKRADNAGLQMACVMLLNSFFLRKLKMFMSILPSDVFPLAFAPIMIFTFL